MVLEGIQTRESSAWLSRASDLGPEQKPSHEQFPHKRERSCSITDLELPVEVHSALVRVLECESGVWFLGLLLFLAMI